MTKFEYPHQGKEFGKVARKILLINETSDETPHLKSRGRSLSKDSFDEEEDEKLFSFSLIFEACKGERSKQ